MAVLAVGIAFTSTTPATQQPIKRACWLLQRDAVDSRSLRFCMRRAQARLPQACVKELAPSKGLMKMDDKRYRALQRQ